MKTNKFIMLYALCAINTLTICEQNNPQPKMKFFNKHSESRERNQENYKKRLETKISDLVDEKANTPKIIKYFVSKYSEDVKEVLLWAHEIYNSKEMCEYRDEKEALKELDQDATRIGKENELPWYSQTASECMWESYDKRTPTCRNLAQAYDSFRFHSQGVPEARKIKSLDHQINLHFDEQYTVAFLEKTKKKLQEDLKKTNLPLYNTLQERGVQHILDSNSSFLETLSEKDKQTLIATIENVVCEKITNVDNLAEEFQKILYVFHEKAARKHLNETEALKELREDIARTSKQKGSFSTYSHTAHLCELERIYTNTSFNRDYGKTAECKKLAQAYKELRSYSSMHEIKKTHSLQNQINGKSNILKSLWTDSNNEPAIAFLKEEKAALEEEIKRINNGNIPTTIPSYYGSRSEEDQKKIDTIIKNAVKKKYDKIDDFAEEYQLLHNVFDEKL